MTRERESAPAGTDAVAPSTRRSRREGEREAQSRALYVEQAQAPSTVRVVDGGAPIYRTRRAMRESASRLAHDLPVVVADDAAPSAPVETTQAAAASVPTGRRARRLAATGAAGLQEPATTQEHATTRGDAGAPAREADAQQHGTRRARRSAGPSVATPAPETPEVEAPVRTGSWHDLASSPAPVAEAPAPLADAPASTDEASTAAADEPAAPVVQEADDDGDALPTRPVAGQEAAARAAQAAARATGTSARPMTRAERRAAAAATSDEVSAAVAAVLGGEQPDAASTPVRTPLRMQARSPRPAVVGRSAIAPVVRPSRRARSRAARRAVQRVAAAGVILVIGGLVTVTSLPAQAFAPGASEEPTAYGDVQVEQQLDVTSGSGAHGDEEVTAVLSREDFNVDDAIASTRMTPDELAALQAVADTDEIGPYYDGEPSMPNLWAQLETSYTQSPFPSLAEVPVSSGFGYRWGSFHGGVDLIPGAGTPVYPIANGVVVAVWQGNNPGGGGYEVIVEHNIDGQFFQSWYPHMAAGSILVEEGQVVDISTQLGAVGSTGRSTGPHLHLEIKNSDYISVDPLVWLATREQILEP